MTGPQHSLSFAKRLLQVAQGWRSGAAELREQFREQGRVPFSVEVGGAALELCATRLEDEVREDYARQCRERRAESVEANAS